MLKNFFKVALRNLINYKGYSFINIAGLAIGIASAIIIFLFVQDELSFDRHNENYDQIYRIYLKGKIQGNEIEGAISNAPMGPTLVEEYPEVLNYVRLFTFGGEPVVRYEEQAFVERSFIYADSTFFDVFTAKAIQGDPSRMLTKPNTVVLTRETADKYFGEEDPMGKILEVGEDRVAYEVTGIVEGFPENSHFTFDMLGSMATTQLAQSTFWVSNNNYTYILLKEDFPYKQLEDKFPDLMVKYVGPQLQQFLGISLEEFAAGGNNYGYFLQPLKDIHLRSDLEYDISTGGSIATIYIFSIIAIFIIIIASINFMNLATARSAGRANEVGIRKVVGSDRRRLIIQFLAESVLLTFISLILAIVLVELCLTFFNNLSQKELNFSFSDNPILIPVLILLGLVVGIFSGSYPAFFLAAFQPVSVLKGKLSKGMKGGMLRSILVIIQFAVTIMLFISTIIVLKQMNYIRTRDLGFNRDNIVVLDRAYILRDRTEPFKQELLKNPNIQFASYSNTIPGSIFGNTAYVPEGAGNEETHSIDFIFTDVDFIDTYELEMRQGRWFNNQNPTDSIAIIMNESAVKALGFNNPLEERMLTFGFGLDSIPLQVIGVIKDFHYKSLHHEIKPLVIHHFRNFGGRMSIKITEENRNETLEYISSKWDEFVPDQPIISEFLEDEMADLYQQDKSTGQIFSIFSILAIFIAALGLLGLASFSAEQRTKEVGIRKVFGSSVSGVVGILSREVVWLILIATLIAWPLGYFFMKDWLQDFAIRIELSWWVFLLSTLLALFIAFITVSFRAYQAAVVNPARSLRYE